MHSKVMPHGSNHSWYCCNCSDGPQNSVVTPSCPWCNDHPQCKSCLVTPPETPPHTGYAYDSTSNKRASSDEASPASLTPDRGYDDREPPSSTADACINEHVRSASIHHTHPGIEWGPLHEAIEQHTKTIVDFRSSLLPRLNLASEAGIKSHPSRGPSVPHAQNGPNQSPSKNNSNRKQSRRNGRKGSGDGPEEQESGDDPSSKLQETKRPRNPDGSLALFACPFCKFNPHRYRNFKPCSRGYDTASDLREHLTRKGGPHELHECTSCLQIFWKEDDCDRHEKLATCQPQEPYYPVEGIGQKLRADGIPKLKGGRKRENSQQEDIDWWNTVYRLLFGEDVAVPPWVYDADEITHRSNDPDLQDGYEDLLTQTLQRRLPKEHMFMVVRCHFLSLIETKTQHLKRKLGDKEDYSLAHQVLSSIDVGKTRRTSVPVQKPGSDNPSTEESGMHFEESSTQPIEPPPAKLNDERVTLSEVPLQHFESVADLTLPNANTDDLFTSASEKQNVNIALHQYGNAPFNGSSNMLPQPTTIHGMGFDTNLPFMPSMPGAPASGYSFQAPYPQLAPSPSALTHNASFPQSTPVEDIPPHKRRRMSGDEERRAHAANQRRITLDGSQTYTETNDALRPLEYALQPLGYALQPLGYAQAHMFNGSGSQAAGYPDIDLSDVDLAFFTNEYEQN